MKTQIEAALNRRVVDTKFAARLTEHFESQNDLFTTCQKCKQQIKGTLAKLKEHECGKGN